MASRKPNRADSAPQDELTYTIRPLKWRRSLLRAGRLVASSAVGAYLVDPRHDHGYRVSIELAGSVTIVAGSATLYGAKMAATLDLERRLRTSLKPVRKAVRRDR